MRAKSGRARLVLAVLLSASLVIFGSALPAAAQGFDSGQSIADMSFAVGVAADADGTRYVAAQGGDLSTQVQVIPAGAYVPNAALALQAPDPWGFAFDSAGNIFVSSSTNHAISVFAPGAQVATRVIDTGSEINPLGIAIDAANRLYVADYLGGRVEVYEANASTPNPTSEITGLPRAASVALNSVGDVFVGTDGGDAVNPDTVTVWERQGDDTFTQNTGRTVDDDFRNIDGLAFDPTGRLYVANETAVEIYRVNTTPPTHVKSLTGLTRANGVWVDAAAWAYVADFTDGAIRVYSPGPVFSADPDLKSYGDVFVNTFSATQVFTVTNRGTRDLVIPDVALGGTNANQFHITDDSCGAQTLTTSGSTSECTVSVQFRPTSSGSKDAEIQFTDNTDDSPDTIPLDGRGVAPVFSPSQGTLAYGDQLVPDESAGQNLTITNNGNTGMIFGSGAVTITGGDPAAFNLIADTCSSHTIAVGNTCSVTATFEPSTVGNKSAQLHFVDNALNTPQEVGLSGRGVAPVHSATPTTKDFGDVVIDHNSPTQLVRVTNDGTYPLIFLAGPTGVQLSGDTGDFEVTADDCTGQSVAAADHCDVTVRMSPTTLGAKAATLTMADNASDSPHTISLSGVSVPPSPTFSPDSATKAFGNVMLNQAAANATVTITNTGTSDLVVAESGVTLSGANPADFSIVADNCGGQSVAVNDDCTVVVGFTPSATGDRAANLTFDENTNAGTHSVALTGTGMTVTSQPLSVGGTVDNARVNLTWSAPSDAGGVALIGYRVRVGASVGGPYSAAAGSCAPGATATSTARACVATGLVNGRAYFFKVLAVNAAGDSSLSSASPSLTPKMRLHAIGKCANFPKSLARKGVTTLFAKTCRTTNSNTVLIYTFKATTKTKPKILSKAGGKKVLRTMGKRGSITLTLTAPQTGDYAKYTRSKTYKV